MDGLIYPLAGVLFVVLTLFVWWRTHPEDRELFLTMEMARNLYPQTGWHWLPYPTEDEAYEAGFKFAEVRKARENISTIFAVQPYRHEKFKGAMLFIRMNVAPTYPPPIEGDYIQ